MDQVTARFAAVYYPRRCISVNEAMILFKDKVQVFQCRVNNDSNISSIRAIGDQGKGQRSQRRAKVQAFCTSLAS